MPDDVFLLHISLRRCGYFPVYPTVAGNFFVGNFSGVHVEKVRTEAQLVGLFCVAAYISDPTTLCAGRMLLYSCGGCLAGEIMCNFPVSVPGLTGNRSVSHTGYMLRVAHRGSSHRVSTVALHTLDAYCKTCTAEPLCISVLCASWYFFGGHTFFQFSCTCLVHSWWWML